MEIKHLLSLIIRLKFHKLNKLKLKKQSKMVQLNMMEIKIVIVVQKKIMLLFQLQNKHKNRHLLKVHKLHKNKQLPKVHKLHKNKHLLKVRKLHKNKHLQQEQQKVPIIRVVITMHLNI